MLPAALAAILAAAVKLGKDVFRPSAELILAAAAFTAVFFFDANPAMMTLLKWNQMLSLFLASLLGIVLKILLL